MRKRLIVLFTIILVLVVKVEAQGKWNLRVNAGTNYAIPASVFEDQIRYTSNKTWYPGLDFGTAISYNVFTWLAVEAGLNFEKIRTGSDVGLIGHSGSHINYYAKNYLKIPLILLFKTSPNFGVFGGSGYRYCLSEIIGMEKSMEWNELLFTGGIFLNIGRIRTSLSYTQGTSEKTVFYFSQNRTISLNIGYTLWTK